METVYRDNILFVDDERNMLDSIRRTLYPLNNRCNMHFCSNGNDALVLCEEIEFDLIVTDGKMPAMSGIEFVRMLKGKERTKDIPIIMLTGDNGLKMKALQYGVVEFLNKPLVQDEFILRLTNILKMKQLTRELGEKNQKLMALNSQLVESNQQILLEQQKIIELEQKNSIMAMVVTANHEINQPLCVIWGTLEMMKLSRAKKPLEQKQNEYLDAFEKNLIKIDNILKRYKCSNGFRFVDYSSNSKMVVFEDEEKKEVKE